MSNQEGAYLTVNNEDRFIDGETVEAWLSYIGKLEQENAELKKYKEMYIHLSAQTVRAEEKVEYLERIIAESQKQKPYKMVLESVRGMLVPVRLYASPVIQEGMQLVPIAPSIEQVQAALKVDISLDGELLDLTMEEITAIYKAMLNASKEG